VAVAALLATWIVTALAGGHNIRDFANVGSRAGQSNAVQAIHADATYSFSDTGYDGQYFLAIARAPTRAGPYLDFPVYRYSRIGYPVLAHLLAFGRQGAIPYLLVIINAAAVALAAVALGLWLARRGLSPWFALIFALFPGVIVGIQRDLSEPLAYCLAAFGLLAFEPRRLNRILLSIVLFGAAGIVRESALVLALGCAAVLLVDRRGPHLLERVVASAAFLASVVFPYLVLRIVLTLLLPNAARGDNPTLAGWPFKTLISGWRHEYVAYVIGVVAPAVLVGLVALLGLARRTGGRELLPLLVAVAAFVVLAPRFAYDDPAGALRSSVAVPLATVFSIPSLDRATAGRRLWLWVAVALWATPWGELLPFALNHSWS
jgi:hypothetical protein